MLSSDAGRRTFAPLITRSTPAARADLDFAVAARKQHDHAVVFARLADAPTVDDVGGVVRWVFAVEEIHDDGDCLNAGRFFQRRAILLDDRSLLSWTAPSRQSRRHRQIRSVCPARMPDAPTAIASVKTSAVTSAKSFLHCVLPFSSFRFSSSWAAACAACSSFSSSRRARSSSSSMRA